MRTKVTRKVRTNRKIRCLIANDHSHPIPCLNLGDGFAQHFSDIRVERVHLGVELETNYTVAEIDQARAFVLAYHTSRGLQRVELEFAFIQRFSKIGFGGGIVKAQAAVVSLVESL